MRRDELEHVIRAAASVAGENEIVVVGSQAILALIDRADAFHPKPCVRCYAWHSSRL